jgi:acetyl-CoA synthetase
MPPFVWRPSADLVAHANVTRLGRRLGAGTYAELHRISVEEPERFWPAVVADLGLEFSRSWDTVVDTSHGPEWAQWFVGGRGA